MTPQPYLKQKLHLYFDENFPEEVVDQLRSNSYWRRTCKVYSAKTEAKLTRGDGFHFNHCRKHKLVLVTLDKNFMDDRKYPFDRISGIIRVVARRNDTDTIAANLENLLEFLYAFPLPRDFVGETKFEVTSRGCKVRGRHAITRQVKSVNVKGATPSEQ